MADSIFGTISPPTEVQTLIGIAGTEGDTGAGLCVLLNRIFTIIETAAGIFFVIQILLAGFAYISASGDQKKTEAAWAKIYQSIIGLLIVSSAFVLTQVIGNIVGMDNILNPTIPKN